MKNSRTIHTSILAAILLAFAFCGTVHAEEIDGRAEYFSSLYLKLCMKNIDSLGALRTQLTNNKLPKFPPEQAAHFLNNKDGDAWPVPYQEQQGNFVLTLPAGDSFYSVLVRRANQADVERQFIKLVATAPPPLVSEMRTDEHSETPTNGRTHTISYLWSLPQATKKMMFTLTTAYSENAQLQVVASTTIIKD